jgi:predicted small secreted protein
MKRFILLSLVMAMFAGTLVACHAEGDVGHDTAQVMPGR